MQRDGGVDEYRRLAKRDRDRMCYRRGPAGCLEIPDPRRLGQAYDSQGHPLEWVGRQQMGSAYA